MFMCFDRSLACAAILLAVSAVAQADPLAVKDGDKIAFMGDSITAQGWDNNLGYIRLVVNALGQNGIKVTPIPAGSSGNKSNDMLSRLEKDVISKKPEWMTLSCGVNDVWHGERGIPLEQYKKNITEIVAKAQAANIKVMILTATMIEEDATNANNRKLVAYNDFLRTLAKEKKCLLADLNADMQAKVAELQSAAKKKGNMLTVDGVHMNVAGNQMMAAGILRTFGFDDAQLVKAREGWLDMPGGVTLAKRGITLRQFATLQAYAATQKTSVEALVDAAFTRATDELLKKAGTAK